MKISDKSLLSCWPDGFSRYYAVTNILKLIFSEQSSLSILDVGGDSQWMSRFLDETGLQYTLNIVDTRKPDFKSKNSAVSYTREDFFKLSATDYPSDAVINTDVLEHIPAGLKNDFVDHCITFARSAVVFSAPQDDDEVTAAEHQINDSYIKLADKQQYWLKEHFEFGKPNPQQIEATIQKHDLPYLCIDTNNLDNWLLSFSINFINSEVTELEGMDDLNRYYNENIHQVGDFSGKPYRKIFVVFKDQELFEQKQAAILDFFKPNISKKNEFIVKCSELLTINFSKMSIDLEATKANLEALESEHQLTLKNLEQTQTAYVDSTRELETIKMSKVYRYAVKLQRIVKPKTT